MKNIFKLVAILGLLTAGVACENKSSNVQPQPLAPSAELSQMPAAAETVLDPQAALSPSGAAVTTSTVIAHHSDVGLTPAGNDSMTWEEIIAAYPELADRIIFLSNVDRIVETDAHTFDLYSAEKLVMTLGFNEAGDALLVRNADMPGYAADSITFQSIPADQNQGAANRSLDFVMSSCNVATPAEEPAQEQEQAQTGKEAPVKEEPVAQEQEQAQVGKEAPVKEEPAKEEPKQECASIVATLVLQEVVQKQEQEQKQEMTKEEPAKEEEKAQDQAQQEAPVKAAPVEEAPKAPEQEQKG